MAVVEHTLGTVVPDATVQVIARVEGVLETAYFQEGQFVKKGQLLFQIDPRPLQATLAQARATLEHDQAMLRNAERDKLRYQRLFKQDSASSQQLDTAVANADALAATVALDKAAVNSAQLNLGYSQIRSPIDGKTGALLVQPGKMISGTPSATLVTINKLRPIKLAFDLPQSDYLANPGARELRSPAHYSRPPCRPRRSAFSAGLFHEQRRRRPERNGRAARHLRQHQFIAPSRPDRQRHRQAEPDIQHPRRAA